MSASVLALGVQAIAIPGAFAQSAPSTEPQPQQLPAVNVQKAAQKKKAAVKKAAPKATAPRAATQSAAAPTVTLPEILNVAAQTRQTEPESSASEMTLSGQRIIEQPYARPGEFLEVTPGLVVTQHSGEGKANQYFLRGFNLDHGTDLAIWVDGMPVNMRTHGHGQGYADINFLIPELIQSMRVRKGPYFADEGDFSSAGAPAHRLSRHVQSRPVAGNDRHVRLRARARRSSRSRPARAISWWRAKAPSTTGRGTFPTGCERSTVCVRYSQGTALEGFSITGMAYDNRWTSTDQVAKRAIDQGLIDRFGSLDPSDGGRSSRYSLSTRFSTLNDWGVTKIEAYAIRYTMTLFNNFTYFLDNEVEGDQFSQTDSRTIYGFHGNHTFKGRLGPFDSETRIGVQGRYDDINVGLHNTVQRQLLSTVRADDVTEGSIALYAQNTTHWTSWMRTIAGGRGDWYRAKVVSDNPLNSGNAGDFIASPKFSLIFGPFRRPSSSSMRATASTATTCAA